MRKPLLKKVRKNTERMRASGAIFTWASKPREVRKSRIDASNPSVKVR